MPRRVVVRAEQEETVPESYLIRLGGWTLERYLAEAPEDALWEFVRGEVIVHSPATAEHQDLVRFLLRLLDGYCEQRQWGRAHQGPAALQILPEVIREPDVFVLPPEELERARGVPLPVRPALIVEVISPSTRTLDLEEKARDYEQAGIPEYWAVDREHRILWVHRWSETGYKIQPAMAGLLESVAVPGFRLRVEWLWRDPLPRVDLCLREIPEPNID